MRNALNAPNWFDHGEIKDEENTQFTNEKLDSTKTIKNDDFNYLLIYSYVKSV